MAADQEDCSENCIAIKYIGQKIAKVRWKPSHFGQLRPSDKFITGSWDDERNLVSLWNVGQSKEGKYFENEATGGEPELLCSALHNGSVTDIEFVASDHFITSSSCGNITLYETTKDEKEILAQRNWSGTHHFGKEQPCSCTNVSVSQSNFVSVGEDGRINVFQVEQINPLRVIDNAECVSITSVIHTKTNEIVTTNSIGQLKAWDLRQSGSKAMKTMLPSGEKVALESVDRHPYQPYLVVTGSSDGVVGVWDLRHERYPVAMIDAHDSEVWEVKFHSLYPDNMFTCSEDGSAWYWDGTSISTASSTIVRGGALPLPNMESIHSEPQQAMSPWLLVDTNKDMLETYSLLPVNNLPVNSLDVDSKSLVCGTDGEAIIIVRDLPLK